MQTEKVEIEEVELTQSTTKAKKEFEKILIRQRNRELNTKAQNLVKMGCFDQSEEVNVDFSKLEKCTYEKPYKQVYELYKDKDDNLFYIAPKTEGDSKVAYAYDVVAIENVSDEEYSKIYKASRFEGIGFAKGLYITSIVFWGIMIAILALVLIYNIVEGSGFFDIVLNIYSYFAFFLVGTALIAILQLTLRKFIGK